MTKPWYPWTHYIKIMKVIASCENPNQLRQVQHWINNIFKVDTLKHVREAYIVAINGRYERLIQEFNTRKAKACNQTIQEYTQGRQKFYTEVY